MWKQALLLFSCLLVSRQWAQAGVIGAVSASPSSVPAGAATNVTFTAVISDPAVISSSVNLQQVNSTGQATNIGTMYDDGTHGDSTAGDHIYTLSFSIFQQTTGALSFRVSAGFQGSLSRALSAPIPVSVTGMGTAINITSPSQAAYLNISPTVVTGTVADPHAVVTVNGLAAQLSGNSFSASVPLREGSNPITAVAQNTNGLAGTASETVTLDTTPPHVTISAPATAAVTSGASIDVSGIVNDIVVGTINSLQAGVTVNGITASVLNRTYLAANVPLQLGANTITATARDRAGNFATTSVLVTRVAAANQSTLSIVSGNGLTGPIKSLLAAPLVVQALNAAGQPIPNTPVVFRVVSGDGNVTAGSPPGMGSMAVNTNAQGQAQIKYILGARAGAGNNQVQASTVGISATPVFTESATSTDPAMIVVDSGGNQNGVVGQALPLPFIAIVTDSGHNRLANVPVSFSVVQGGGTLGGQNAITATSDGDGRVEAVLTLGSQSGVSTNVVNATFAGNTGLPASFTASAFIPGPPSSTSISGVVLDNSSVPIPGVTMRLYQVNNGGTGVPQQVVTPVQTDARGYFSIHPAPVGVYKLMADGTTATRPGPFPTLEYDLTTVSGQNNTVGLPIYLPQLLPGNQLCVSPTVGGTLTIPQAPGFALNIAAGSAMFPGGSRSGCVSVTPVNMDKVPMVPGFGQQPRFIVTIQPVGTTFNPPAQITIPNVDGLAPRAATEMYSYDHDLASFVAIGTGTVSNDGSVIASDPGVGVLKAGWHCGGDPNSSGSAASLAVTLSASVSQAAAGDTVTMTAAGTPPLDGEYINWEVIDDPADPNDDPTVATFVTTPNCPSQATCAATLKGVKIGIASVRVTFRCTTTGNTVVSAIVKVTFTLGLKPKEVSFTDDIDIYKDQVGAIPIVSDPIWKDTNTPAQNEIAAYVRNTKMKVTVKFAVNPVPAAPVTGVTIEGEIPGLGKFRITGVTIPAAAEVTIPGIQADTALPNTTKFYNPLTINWRHMRDGDSCPQCTADGSTANKVYATLDTPTQPLTYTTLKLALSSDGAATQADAFTKTWANFAGPANITGWDARKLYYYRPGFGFGACAVNPVGLLTSASGSGQCGSFAQLLMWTLGVNGISSDFVSINSKDGTKMIVKDWTFAGAGTFPAQPDFKWKLVLNVGDYMVPPMPGNVYGDLTSLNSLAGQNTAPPSEKVFDSHFIVKVATAISGGDPYFDPSYGVTYASDANFEAKALNGYASDFSDGPGIYRARKTGGAVNVTLVP